MNARKTMLVALVLLCCLAVAVSAAGGASLVRSGFASIAGPVTGTGVNMEGSLGQLVAGPSGAPGVSVHPDDPAPPPPSSPPFHPVHLPLVVRDS